MMRSLLPLLLLVSTSAYAAVPIKWSETLVKNLNTKTLRQAFCEKNVGYRAQAGCDAFSKEKAILDQKVSSARVEGSSLFITVGKRTVEIKATADTNIFEINRKTIDLKNYTKPADLVKALQATFPKLANGSLWMNAAYAQETPLELMSGAASLMLYSTSDQNWCSYAEKFVRACNSNLSEAPEKTQWENITKKIANRQVLNSDDLRWLDDDEQNLRVLAYQMRKVVAELNRADAQSALKLCPSYTVPALANAQEDVRKCDKILFFKNSRLKAMPEMAKDQQYLLGAKNLTNAQITARDKQREEVVTWMEYLISNESKAPTPNEIMKMPTQ
jgi:hypothetical protein